MFISEDNRKRGFGKEIVAAICEHFKDIGFNEVRLGVSLKNWPGIGDTTYSLLYFMQLPFL
jgi:hypothetical protein